MMDGKKDWAIRVESGVRISSCEVGRDERREHLLNDVGSKGQAG